MQNRLYFNKKYNSALGAIYTTGRLSVLLLTMLVLAEGFYFATSQFRNSAGVFNTFWGTPSYAIYGLIVPLIVVLLPWLIIPMSSGLIRRTPASFFLQNDIFWVVMVSLGFLTIFAGVLTMACVPGFILDVLSFGIDIKVLNFALSSVTAIPLLDITKRVIARFNQRHSTSLLPGLADFSHLRPLNSRIVNLNIGALAPRLDVVATAVRRWNRVVDEKGPTSVFIRDRVYSVWPANEYERRLASKAPWSGVDSLRIQIASHLNVSPNAIMFAANTTSAIKAVLESVRPNVIVRSDHEHESCETTLTALGEKYDTKDVVVPLNYFEDDNWEDLYTNAFVDMCVRNQAECALLSHICHSNGLVIPVNKIANRLREMCPSLIFIVDGAHALGHIGFRLDECNCDFYATAGHKWLYGPPCLGILIEKFNGAKSLAHLHQSLTNELHGALSFYGKEDHPNASSVNYEPFVGLSSILNELQGTLYAAVLDNLQALREHAVDMIGKGGWDMKVVHINTQAPGIINIQKNSKALSFVELEKARQFLELDQGVSVKTVVQPVSLRICLPFYLRLHELQKAIEAIGLAFDRTWLLGVAPPNRKQRRQSVGLQ